jgi:hypothetical protein
MVIRHENMGLDMVEHAYNPSYVRGIGMRNAVQGWSMARSAGSYLKSN